MPSTLAASPPPMVGKSVWAVRRHDGSVLHAGSGCAVMAVLNVTPDSFSDGGRYADSGRARERIDELLAQGADIVDIGAESTRPGAESLSPEEEWHRLSPLFLRLDRAQLRVALSLDTRHAEVARRAAKHGVAMLNLPFPQDLLLAAGKTGRGRRQPSQLTQLLAAFDATVLMHARGNPATMRQLTDYGDNLCQTVVDELRQTAASLTEDDPVLRRRLIFDPGLGFAKTAEQSLELLARTAWLRAAFSAPILIGASRKSMLGAVTGQTVDNRLIPSVIAAAWAAQQGADIVRVHDVAETQAALQLVQSLRAAGRHQPALAQSASERDEARP